MYAGCYWADGQTHMSRNPSNIRIPDTSTTLQLRSLERRLQPRPFFLVSISFGSSTKPGVFRRSCYRSSSLPKNQVIDGLRESSNRLCCFSRRLGGKKFGQHGNYEVSIECIKISRWVIQYEEQGIPDQLESNGQPLSLIVLLVLRIVRDV